MIAGGGLAGLSAGLFSARCGRSTLVLVPLAPGGELLNVETVEDYPGFPDGIAGVELCLRIQEHAERYGAHVKMGEMERLERDRDAWTVIADVRYQARTVVIATGTRRRKLEVPGAARLWGRGVSNCASCDGPILSGATVGVIGGGDSALQEALALAQFAGQVIIFNRGKTVRAQDTYWRRAQEHEKIVIRLGAVVEEILGDETVRGVRVRDIGSGRSEDVELTAIFVYAGVKPATESVSGLLALDDLGRIVTDVTLNAGLPGLFAAGDIRSGSSGQAVAAAGDGAAAAMAAHRYLTRRERSSDAANSERAERNAPDVTALHPCRGEPAAGERGDESLGVETQASPLAIREAEADPPSGDAMSLSVLDPTGTPPLSVSQPLAPRLPTLEDKTVVLIDVQMENSDLVIEQIRAWFATNMPTVRTPILQWRGKIAADVDHETLEQAGNGDAVIMGVGL